MKIERPKQDEILARLNNNNFVMNPLLGVAITGIIGFNVMMASIYISQSGYVGMFVLLGTIGVILSFIAGRAEYLLTNEEIYQSLTPFVSDLFQIKSKERFFPFELIYYYQVGEDVDRSMQPYKKLTLNMSIEPNKLILTNKKEPDEFEQFVAEFEVLIGDKNKQAEQTVEEKLEVDKLWQPQIIKKKKSFYETVLAKVLSLFFLVLTIGFLVLSLLGVLSFSGLFRVYILLVPGVFIC